MNREKVWAGTVRAIKVLVVPIGVVLLFFSCPWFRGFLATAFQSHPLWSALVLSVLCFIVGFLLVGTRSLAPNAANQYRDIGVILLILLFILGIGIVFVGASTGLASPELKLAAFRTASLWSGAYLMAGFVVGFLFGIPRVLQADETAPANRPPGGYTQKVNTNLEQISDWLTKIIVGLGLVELKQIPAYLERAARWTAQCMGGDSPGGPAVSFASSIIIFFSIVGFLAGYLITRLFLAGAFGRADQNVYQLIDVKLSENREAIDLGNRIRNFWSPGNVVNQQNERQILDWMARNGLEDRMITELLIAPDLQKSRQKIVADIPIP